MANLSEQESWIDGIYQLETSDPVVAGPGGISNRQAEQLASRTAYLKKMQETTGDSVQKHLAASDPHAQYAPKNSPALTGTPTAPTTAQTANNTQIATTAFVKSAIAALISGSPAALDTLQELANALGNDPHFSTTVVNAIADVKTDVANKLNAHASILDAHPQYAPKASPAFTGTPTAPTAASGSNDTQLATTAFVKAAVAALVNGSPAALDTLQELAKALGNDPNFSTTVLNALAGKLAKDQNGTDIPDKPLFRQNVGLGNVMMRGEFGVGGIKDLRGSELLGAPIKIYGLGTFFGFSRTEDIGLLGVGMYCDLKINGGWTDKSGIESVSRVATVNGNQFTQHAIDDETWSMWRPVWNSETLAHPLTEHTDQWITGYKQFQRNYEALKISPKNQGYASYIIGKEADGSSLWYVGRGADFINNISLSNYMGRNGIHLLANGDVQIEGRSVSFLGSNGFVKNANKDVIPSDQVTKVWSEGQGMGSLSLIESEKWYSYISVRHRGGAAGTDSDDYGFVIFDKDMAMPSDEFYIQKQYAGGWRNPIRLFHSGNLTPAAIGAMSSTELAGMPQLFPGAVAPTGWLKCNGQQFDTAQFPVLASRYPSGFLPDLRGEFVRGWDDGRGADAGRTLLSAQGDAIRNITGSVSGAIEEGNAYAGAFYETNGGRGGTGGGGDMGLGLDASRVVPTANENRPRNIAFNYIVRAA
ncbi:phage tail protein [Pectobacterium polaris]|uniref:phage tail protein n=1 Tax=Pectobacterium polaris TaxID=2042057 RepID=UPI000FACA36B|nr:phage tail protein [Pectobacterium polaris]RUS02614.1 tail fiber protein [Pectobacterium polaris]